MTALPVVEVAALADQIDSEPAQVSSTTNEEAER
jgi:hypothetical protein